MPSAACCPARRAGDAGACRWRGERPDLLAQRFYGDPGQWWRIADANPVVDPRELTDEAGRIVEIPEPGGHRRV